LLSVGSPLVHTLTTPFCFFPFCFDVYIFFLKQARVLLHSTYLLPCPLTQAPTLLSTVSLFPLQEEKVVRNLFVQQRPLHLPLSFHAHVQVHFFILTPSPLLSPEFQKRLLFHRTWSRPLPSRLFTFNESQRIYPSLLVLHRQFAFFPPPLYCFFLRLPCPRVSPAGANIFPVVSPCPPIFSFLANLITHPPLFRVRPSPTFFGLLALSLIPLSPSLF